MSSQFEFLGSTTMGQYIPRASWFHKRDPRARLLTFVLVFAAIIISPGLLGVTFGGVLVIFLFIISKLPLKTTLLGIRQAIPFIFLLGIIQLLFFSRPEQDEILWTVFTFQITTAAAHSALMLIIRFIVLISLLNSLAATLSTSQITTSVFYLLKPIEKIGFPVNDLTMVIQVTLRFLPVIAQTAEKTAKAQAARGGDWDKRGFNPIRQAKRILPIIIPVFTSSLSHAEKMALAMEARGFSAADKRSSLYELQFTWIDATLLLFAVAASILIIYFGLLS